MKCARTEYVPMVCNMRDLDVIDSELRLLAAVRRTAREGGYPMPTIAVIDQLLDERGGQPAPVHGQISGL